MKKFQEDLLFLCLIILCHVPGLISTSMGKISSLPAIISKQKTYFDKSEKPAKFPVAPTASKPGPMLLIVAATAVKLVFMLKLSSEITRTDTMYTKIYEIMKVFTERIVECSTSLPSNLTFLTVLG